MTWVGTLAMAALSLGVGAFVYALTANLETQPEYPPVATEAMRIVGGFIAACGVVFGLALLGDAIATLLG